MCLIKKAGLLTRKSLDFENYKLYFVALKLLFEYTIYRTSSFCVLECFFLQGCVNCLREGSEVHCAFLANQFPLLYYFLYFRNFKIMTTSLFLSLSQIGFYVSEAELELTIPSDDVELLLFLLLPPKCWGYRDTLPGRRLGIKPRVSPALGKHSTN